jgi:hypothetical protein
MGLPAGWVTDVPGLGRNEQLKALGNGVVPAAVCSGAAPPPAGHAFERWRREDLQPSAVSGSAPLPRGALAVRSPQVLLPRLLRHRPEDHAR